MTCKDVVVDRLRRGLRGRSQTRLIDMNHDVGCKTDHSRNRLVIETLFREYLWKQLTKCNKLGFVSSKIQQPPISFKC